MCRTRQPNRTSLALPLMWLGLALLLPCCVSSNAQAYTPEDPVVKKMVTEGIKYLEASTGKVTDLGEQTVVAYAHFKVEHDETNPVVVQGIAAAMKIIDAASSHADRHKLNYEAAVATLLLASISVDKYRPQLTALQHYFDEVQLANGPWTYHGEQLGDVSQTQYGILAIWTLDRYGFPLKYDRVAETAKWLMRVQDSSGPWPYMGKDPGSGQLLRQERTDMSMALAGGSSLLIAGDALRIWGDTTNDEDPGIVGLPEAVKLFIEDANKDRRKKTNLTKEPIMRSIGFMEQWRQGQKYQRTGLDWYYYQIYTMERYESFVEIALGKEKDQSPAWYNKGVDELRKYQDPATGGWTDRSKTTGPVSTAFAILFLIRSTQKAIFTAAGGGASGGKGGFGTDMKNVKLVNGQVVQKVPAQAVNDLLDMLDKDGSDKFDSMAMAENAKLPTDPVARAAQLDRLERLVRGSDKWQARRVAARLLGTSDELRVVPALIFALSDPDLKVRQFARDGLRFISRKFEGYGMPDKPTEPQLRAAQKKWRDWYRTMNPGYVFLDADL
ncbi:prenyltransferase/squalene oxidase repeat-containing protein [Stieleria varia]|nr:hypothetical protein [Stieleria varia]